MAASTYVRKFKFVGAIGAVTPELKVCQPRDTLENGRVCPLKSNGAVVVDDPTVAATIRCGAAAIVSEIESVLIDSVRAVCTIHGGKYGRRWVEFEAV